MKKLTLKIDALQVESFVTARGGGLAGTVRGHDTYNLTCDVPNTYQKGCTATGCIVTAAAGGCTVFPCGPVASENSCLNTCGDGDACDPEQTLWDGCTNNYKLCG